MGGPRLGRPRRHGRHHSIMQAQQIILATAEEALRPFDLTFARYEALVLLAFSRNGSLPSARWATG